MRISGILAVGAFAALSACDRSGGGSASDAQAQADPSILTSSGEVALADGGSMSFSITSERYKQWDQARRAFPKSLVSRFGQVLQPRSPTEESINNSVALLQSDARALQAIESAGLSVRGFVELTVALEQQMMMASGDGRPDPPPMPEDYPMTMDTSYYQSYPYPMPTPMPVTPMPTPMPATLMPPPAPYTPYPYPVLPPNPSRDSLPARDTLLPARRRDTVLPRRDTLVPPPRPDSQPVRRDSVIPVPPPDSILRG